MLCLYFIILKQSVRTLLRSILQARERSTFQLPPFQRHILPANKEEKRQTSARRRRSPINSCVYLVFSGWYFYLHISCSLCLAQFAGNRLTCHRRPAFRHDAYTDVTPINTLLSTAIYVHQQQKSLALE